LFGVITGNAPSKLVVAGSIPAGRAILINNLPFFIAVIGASDILEQLIKQPNFRCAKTVSNIEQTRNLDSGKQM
jgi:hypothetical protein